MAAVAACHRAARTLPGRALHASAAAAAASSGDGVAGLAKRYSNLDQLEADAKHLLTPQVGKCGCETHAARMPEGRGAHVPPPPYAVVPLSRHACC